MNVASEVEIADGDNAMLHRLLHPAHLLRLRLCINLTSSLPVIPCASSTLALERIRVGACRAGLSSSNFAMEGSGRNSELAPQVAVIGAGGGFLCPHCCICSSLLPVIVVFTCFWSCFVLRFKNSRFLVYDLAEFLVLVGVLCMLNLL